MIKSHQSSSIEEVQTDAAKRRASGEFVRGVSGFRHAIGDPNFPPEENRYHLFVAFNCPWCHRATSLVMFLVCKAVLLWMWHSLAVQKQMIVLDLTYGNLRLNVFQ